MNNYFTPCNSQALGQSTCWHDTLALLSYLFVKSGTYLTKIAIKELIKHIKRVKITAQEYETVHLKTADQKICTFLSGFILNILVLYLEIRGQNNILTTYYIMTCCIYIYFFNFKNSPAISDNKKN
jgi:hypothetical protein